MKKLKYTFIIFSTILFISFSYKSNEKTLNTNILQEESPFIGTWEWENGNQIFRVFIWKQNSASKGDFELVEVNGGIETTIYKSDKEIYGLAGTNWYPVITGGWDGDKHFNGRILDNSIEHDPAVYTLWDAKLTMKISQENCLGCSTTATWKVNYYDLVPSSAAPFNIPTDITLTKIVE